MRWKRALHAAPMTTPPKPPFDLPPSEGPSGDPLIREALAWLVHLNSGEQKPEDEAKFAAWQAASEDHRRAAAKAKSIWQQMGPALVRQRKSRKRTIPVILAAIVGLSATAFMAGVFGPPASYFADHRSSTGEIRSVVLRDGSEVDLDTGTSFDVSDGGRTITLYTGQVFIKVKPGAKPFTVAAGRVRTQALGTAFAVRCDRGRATILVAESAVRVTESYRGQSGPVDVAAGRVVTVSRGTGITTPESADVEALLAWRQGELLFTKQPLSEVVAEIDRYRRGRILVLGSDIQRLPVTGNADLSDIDAFLESLQAALPVKVFRMPGLAIIRSDTARELAN